MVVADRLTYFENRYRTKQILDQVLINKRLYNPIDRTIAKMIKSEKNSLVGLSNKF